MADLRTKKDFSLAKVFYFNVVKYQAIKYLHRNEATYFD